MYKDNACPAVAGHALQTILLLYSKGTLHECLRCLNYLETTNQATTILDIFYLGIAPPNGNNQTNLILFRNRVVVFHHYSLSNIYSAL